MWRYGGQRPLGKRVEVSLALILPRPAKSSVAAFHFESVEPGPVVGTGFHFSPALGSNYVYLPQGQGGEVVVLQLGFDHPLQGLALDLRAWPEKQLHGVEFCSGVLITSFSESGQTAYSTVAEWAA